MNHVLHRTADDQEARLQTLTQVPAAAAAIFSALRESSQAATAKSRIGLDCPIRSDERG